MPMRCCASILLLLVTVSLCYDSSTSSGVEEKERAMRVHEMQHHIDDDLSHHKVMVYSKTYCPYSRRLKRLLSEYHIKEIKIVELDKEDQMRMMQDYLYKLSGIKTVPQLYIDGAFIGGHDVSKKKQESGELEALLKKAHAI